MYKVMTSMLYFILHFSSFLFILFKNIVSHHIVNYFSNWQIEIHDIKKELKKIFYTRGKEKRKKRKLGQAMFKCTQTFSSIKHIHFFPSIFSSFWRENFLIDLERKHQNPTIYFPFFLPNQTHSKLIFLPIFSSKFFTILYQL